MTAIYSKYQIYLILMTAVLAYLLLRQNSKVLGYVRERWNLKPSNKYYVSNILYILFWATLFVSLLDWRGPEISIEATVPTSKTVILIDSSASMFAEDVKPNRLKKSVMLARHLVKRIASGEISILLFSDSVKKLVPFTADRDLLDSRLTALDELNYQDAGSNIATAISETISYIATESKGQRVIGNIVVLSDSETDEKIDVIGEKRNISVAFVAVGTAKGAQIPIRDRNNVFRGYKESSGKPVVSKIEESYLKKLQSQFENFKYWVVYSYSLPTDEIISFLHREKGNESEGTIRQRPVYTHWLLLLALSLNVGYFLLRTGRSFVLQSWIIMLALVTVNNVEATENIRKLQEGRATDVDKTNILGDMIAAKDVKSAYLLKDEIKNLAPKETKLNIATAELANGQINLGLSRIENLDISKLNKEERQKIRENILLAINNKMDQKSGKNGNENKESKDQESQDSQDSQKNQNESKGKGNSNQDDADKENKNDNQEQNEQDKNKQEKNESGEGDKQDNQNQQPQNKNAMDKREKSKSQLQGLLEQLKSDDKQLQKKFIDTSSRENNRSGRDW